MTPVVAVDQYEGISVLMSTSADGQRISDDEEDFVVLEDHESTQEEVMQSDASLFIPGDIFNEIDLDTDEPLRLVVTTFSGSALFQSESLAAYNNNQTTVNRTLNSPIISAEFGGRKIENLQTPIRITLRIFEVYTLYCTTCTVMCN